MAVDTPMNSFRLHGNLSTLDFSPRTIIDVYADLKRRRISMIKEKQCKTFDIPGNISLPIIGGVFNTLPLITFYPENQPEKDSHYFIFSNPIGKGQETSQVSLVFDEVKTESGELDFPFSKLILSKWDKKEPEVIEFEVLQKVTEREFTDEDFIPDMECEPPTEDTQEYFEETYNMIIEWLKNLM